MALKNPPIPPRVPPAPSLASHESTSNYIRKLRQALVDELQLRSRDTDATGKILLLSPNGSVYEVVVSDAGVLSTNLLSS